MEVADSRIRTRVRPSVCSRSTLSFFEYCNETYVEVAKDAEEEDALIPMTSEQMEAEIDHQYFSKDGSYYSPGIELLESGKSMHKELSNEFEERLLQIHKEQMEKWQIEVKELQVLDTANEEADALLLNAKNLLRNVHGES